MARRRRLFNGSVGARIVIRTTRIAVRMVHLRSVVLVVIREDIHVPHGGRSKTTHRNYDAQEQQ